MRKLLPPKTIYHIMMIGFVTMLTIGQTKAQLSIAVSTENASDCNRDDDGTATVVASGATGTVTYAWSHDVAATGSAVSDLAPGYYSVTATDDLGTDEADFAILCTILCGEYNMTMDADCSTELSPSSFGGNDDIHDLVLIDGYTPLATGTTVTADEIGKTLIYEINYKIGGGNACWKTVDIEDKSPPSITCEEIEPVFCFESLDPEELGGIPTTEDCSEVPELNYADWTNILGCDNNALNFDGVDDFVQVSSQPIPSAGFTIEAWVNATSFSYTGRFNRILSIDNDSYSTDNPFTLFVRDDGQIGYVFGTGDAYSDIQNPLSFSPTLLTDTWYHIALSFDGTAKSLYVDGELMGTIVDANTFSNANDKNLLIGAFNSTSTDGLWNGTLDDLRIWNHALDATDIRDRLDSELGGDESGLVAYYSFNEGVAGENNTGIDELPDESSNSNNGTLNNFNLDGASSNWVTDRYESNIYQTRIKRTWTATDAGGMSASCDQIILVKRASLDDVSFPDDVQIFCSELDEDSTTPEITGYPTYHPDDGFDPIDITKTGDGSACMLRAWIEKEVEVFECGATKKILREWRVINMCENGVSNVLLPEFSTHLQTIIVKHDAPELAELEDYTIAADNVKRPSAYRICTSTGFLQTTNAINLCDDQTVSDITIWIPSLGIEIDQDEPIPSPGLPLGENSVYYQITDLCSNVTTKVEVKVTVEDQSGPYCDLKPKYRDIIDASTVVKVDASDFDDGVWDNCSDDVFILVRKTNSGDAYTSFINFGCADLVDGAETTISVDILLLDQDPESDDSYELGVENRNGEGVPIEPDFLGNINYCWQDVILSPKFEITLTCPVDVDLDCDIYDSTVEYGLPTYPSICPDVTYETTWSDSKTFVCDDNALNFDGINDYVEMEDFDLDEDDFTIEFWMKPNSNQPGYIVTNRTTEGDFAGNWFAATFSLFDDNKISFYQAAGTLSGSAVHSTSALIINEWTHVAISRSGTTISIYLNGILDKTEEVPIRSLTVVPAGIARLGAWVEIGGTYYDGTLDDLRVWDASRSLLEIQDNMDQQFDGSETTLISYYQFDEGIAEADNPGIEDLPDLTGEGNDGTLNNFALAAGATSNWVNSRYGESGYVAKVRRTFELKNGETTVATCNQNIFLTGTLTITNPVSEFDDCMLWSPKEESDNNNHVQLVPLAIDDEGYRLIQIDPSETGGPPTISGGICGADIQFEYFDTPVEESADPADPESYFSNNGYTLSFIRTWSIVEGTNLNGCIEYDEFEQVVTATNCCVTPWLGNFITDAGVEIFLREDIGIELPIEEKVFDDYTINWYTTFHFPGDGEEGEDQVLISSLENSLEFRPGDELYNSNTMYHLHIQQIGDNGTSAAKYNPQCLFPENLTTSFPTRIVGLVSTEFGTPLQNVRVALESNLVASDIGEQPMMEVMTDADGRFQFTVDDPSNLVRLTPSKDGDDKDKVSTLDLLTLARHVIGVRTMTSPYAYVAADLTGNGKISTGDLVAMQRLILGINTELHNNSSWRFVREDYVFDDMGTILNYDFPESYEFNVADLSKAEMDDINFIAIKIGDLQGAYGSNLLGGNSTTKTLSLKTVDQTLLPGSIIEVPITAAQAKNLSGYQHAFKYDYDKLAFTGIDFGTTLGLDDHNFGYKNLSNGILTTSWYDTEGIDLEEGTVIYKLRFQAKAATRLSEALSISSEYTNAEAYFDMDQIGGVNFIFESPSSDQLILVNTPNPFSVETQVKYYAPQSGNAVISVSDISGRTIYQIDQEAVKGENQLTISKANLKETGIYILRINLNGSSATQKMILIE